MYAPNNTKPAAINTNTAAAKAQALNEELSLAIVDCIHVPLERIRVEDLADDLRPKIADITLSVLNDVGVIDLRPMAKESCKWAGTVQYGSKDAAIINIDSKYKCFVTVENDVATVYITKGFRDCGERLIATDMNGCYINGNTTLKSTFLDGVAFAIREM